MRIHTATSGKSNDDSQQTLVTRGPKCTEFSISGPYPLVYTSDDVASRLQVSGLYKSDLQVSSQFANDLMWNLIFFIPLFA